jgi:hypothetical protein
MLDVAEHAKQHIYIGGNKVTDAQKNNPHKKKRKENLSAALLGI